MSLRLAALNLALRLTAKPILTRTRTPAVARRSFAAAAVFFRAVPGAVYRPTRRGPSGLWISTGEADGDAAILYLHGGGYVAGSPQTHRKMLARLSCLTSCAILAPAYPLAPEHPAPAAFAAALAAWNGLVAEGYSPNRIAIGGDSAGGGLALALLSHLCCAGAPPAAAFAFSPWTDLTLSGPSIRENARPDPLLPASQISYLRDLVLGDITPYDPRISPLFASFPDCPPVYLAVGSTEILHDDTRRIAEKLRAGGAEVVLELGRRTPHVWQIFQGWLPEADASLARLAGFLAQATSFAPTASR